MGDTLSPFVRQPPAESQLHSTQDKRKRFKLGNQPSLFLDVLKHDDDETKTVTNTEPHVDHADKPQEHPEAVSLQKKVSWASGMLSKHYVKKRSIHFVLDCKFEHFKQQ